MLVAKDILLGKGKGRTSVETPKLPDDIAVCAIDLENGRRVAC